MEAGLFGYEAVTALVDHSGRSRALGLSLEIRACRGTHRGTHSSSIFQYLLKPLLQTDCSNSTGSSAYSTVLARIELGQPLDTDADAEAGPESASAPLEEISGVEIKRNR